MSFGVVAHHDVQAREDGMGRQRRLTAESSDRLDRAGRIVTDRLPEFLSGDGVPCPMAVLSVLDLWRRFGEGNVTVGLVRVWRAGRVARLGFDPLDEEAS